MEATFSGADNPEAGRHWYKNRVDFVGHLMGAMRGIASRWKKKFNPLEPLLEADIIAQDGEDDDVSPLQDAASTEPLAERCLIAREQVERVLVKFSNDQVAIAILRAKCDGVSARQVMQEQGLSPRQYGAALRRIQSQKSVLIIDEYDQMQELLSRWLKAMDYAVVTASTAAEGLHLYQVCSPFNVVIISHSPDLNGVELAVDFRKRNRSQNIIITTPHAGEEDVVHPSELAHVPILLKPFRRMELVAILESISSTEQPRNCRRKELRRIKGRQRVATPSRMKRNQIPTLLQYGEVSKRPFAL
jgi:CheY-like chemotaxis protein